MQNKHLDSNTHLDSLDDLLPYFLSGCKPPNHHRIGIEHEKIGIFWDDSQGVWAAPFFDPDKGPYGNLYHLLQLLLQRGWRPILEGEDLLGATSQDGSVTIEPGGQVEFSGIPCKDAVEAVAQLEDHLRFITPLAQACSIRFLGCGFRPFGTRQDVPQFPKKRYNIMRSFLPTRGQLGWDMMHRTASLQVNVDFFSEQDAMRKLQLAARLSPLTVSLFASSPLENGVATPLQSLRARTWTDTDPARCGIPPWAFVSNPSFADYARWALAAPMFFIVRNGQYISMNGMPFSSFLAQGFQSEQATKTDWELHLSTLFPEARLKQYIEIRSSDAGPMHTNRAIPALWQGLLSSEDTLQATFDLVKHWTPDETRTFYHLAHREGIHATLGRHLCRAYCIELLSIASEGLGRQRSPAEAFLEPVQRLLEHNQSISDQTIIFYNKNRADTKSLVDFLSLEIAEK